MSWRIARSLVILRDQINAAYPGRNKASDGTIGDAAHAASVSDHNPDQFGVVRALDITHDPAHGCDIDQLTDALVDSRDRRISYLIANRLITGPDYGWTWTDYDGDDPHTNHLHLSVVGDSWADDISQWKITTKAKKELTTMAGFIRWADAPEVFYIDGSISRHMTSTAEMDDIRTLSGEGIYPTLGMSGQIRTVSRRSLVPPILPPVPAGWEDRAAIIPVTLTGEQIATLARVAAEAVESRIAGVEETTSILVQAISAAATAARDAVDR